MLKGPFGAFVCLGALVQAAPLAAQSPEEAARAALEAAPVWDGHNDVPFQLRGRFDNVIGEFDFADTLDTAREDQRAMHTDLARLEQGAVGAAAWWLAWVFVGGRVLHSAVQIGTANVRLRGLVFTVNFLAVLALWALALAASVSALH